MIQQRTPSIHDKRYRRTIELLVALRKDNNISQEDLAAVLGWTQPYISKIERLERRTDIIEMLDYVAGVLAGNSIDEQIEAVSKILKSVSS